MLVWVVLFVAIAALLFVGVERLLKRLGIERTEESPGAIREFLNRIEEWQRDHERRRR